MGDVAIAVRILTHAAVTLAAMFVYAAGLCTDLQVSPTMGIALWFLAAAIMVANIGCGIRWARRWWKR